MRQRRGPAAPNAISHVHSGIIENQRGNFAAAIAHAEQAIRLGEGGAVPYLSAAFAAMRLSGDESALAWLDRGLQVYPASCLALRARADVLRTLNRATEGMRDCRQWLTLEPGNGAAHACMAKLYQALGRDEDALQSYGRAAELLPQPAEALTDLAILLLELGRRDAGLHVLERALAADRTFAAAWYTRSDTKTFAPGDADVDVDAMERLLRRSTETSQTPPDRGPPDRDAILLHYALAKAYTDRQEAPKALAHLNSGSRLKRAHLNYDSAVDERYMAAIAAAFPAEHFERLRISAAAAGRVASELPVFILGMPRSGTTLVEQILASHPNVHGGGESAYIEVLVKELDAVNAGRVYPNGVANLAPERLTTLAQRYLGMLSVQTDTLRITDKMPYNFLHIGLIHTILPRARIIHCIRDPLDTCMSCYSKLFRHGHEFSYDLGELGHYYRSYAKLMAHWRSVIPPDRFIDVEYENIVDDTEGQARRLVDFCGLPWADACLRFYETQRTVRTASLHQVRQPVYRASVGRSKSFGSGLALLREALGDLL